MLKKLHYSIEKGVCFFAPTCKNPFLLTSFFLITFLLSGFVGFSQRTHIPDANFRLALSNAPYNVVFHNDSILNSDATRITYLYISNKKIDSLNGIEAFTSLTRLDCNYNQLTSLDVSANTALGYLDCKNNQLTSLDVSENTALAYLDCKNNQLTSLNVANGNNRRINIISFYATGNPNLNCIQVDDATYSSRAWPNKDDTARYSADCSALIVTTAIPDRNFEQALIDLGYDSGEIDGVVDNAVIAGITHLNMNSSSTLDSDKISDLTGIEAFTSLTLLYCYSNSLTSLDVSANTALITLDCKNNQLTSLDVSANTALIILDCGNNDLTSLDVSANTALRRLDCYSNPLTSLDVSENTALAYLDCKNNQLTSLDVANGNNRRISISHFYATGNPNLNCIQVDDTNYSSRNWPNKDDTARYSADCSALFVTTAIPDRNFEQALIRLGHDSGEIDGVVDNAVIAGITSLNVNGSSTLDSDKISDLTGIEAFTSLTLLYCNSNS